MGRWKPNTRSLFFVRSSSLLRSRCVGGNTHEFLQKRQAAAARVADSFRFKVLLLVAEEVEAVWREDEEDEEEEVDEEGAAG